MAIQLPQELFEEILDHLAGDPVSLKACSLVCRSWVPRSRSHLFETCTLAPDNILLFRELLRSPNNCTFVRHVHSVAAFRDHLHRNDDCFNEIAADLRTLTQVRTLRMTLYIRAAPASADGYFRAPGFVAAFPHVTRLVLTCDFQDRNAPPAPLVEVLAFFPALQVLHIREMFGSLAETPVGARAAPPKGLHSLELGLRAAGPILAWLHAFNHLPNVDSVTLPLLQLCDAPTVRAALQQLGGALRHLDIKLTWMLCGTPEADPTSVFDLALHTSLRTLTIRDFSWPQREDIQNHFLALITRLASPALECLAFDVDLWLYQSLNWAALDAFLSPARFPLLRRVAFRCSSGTDRRRFLRGALPKLNASGVLQIVWRW
ncbi:hypothetical protein B0H19DRAFT_1378147 [Mycena capillaripes]|nr:hypothetical protein B0H19DRAFT_1378147 [Mycena capillaripes]